MKTNVTVEYAGNQYEERAILSGIKDAWVAAGKKVKDIKRLHKAGGVRRLLCNQRQGIRKGGPVSNACFKGLTDEEACFPLFLLPVLFLCRPGCPSGIFYRYRFMPETAPGQITR